MICIWNHVNLKKEAVHKRHSDTDNYKRKKNKILVGRSTRLKRGEWRNNFRIAGISTPYEGIFYYCLKIGGSVSELDYI